MQQKTLTRKTSQRQSKNLIPARYEDQLYQPIRALLGDLWRTLKPIYQQKFRVSLGPTLKLAPKVESTFSQTDEDPNVKRFVARFTAQMDQSAKTAKVRYGLDTADEWSITDQSVYDQIQASLVSLCQATIDEMTAATGKAYEQIQESMRRDIMENQRAGATLLTLTRQLETYFSESASWRARRIAHTESARAHNYGTIEGLKDSDEVTGWEWVLSDDACDLCHQVGVDPTGKPRQILKGNIFAYNDSAPAAYAQVKCPPLHPSCRCAVVPVLPFEETRFSPTVQISRGKVTQQPTDIETKPPVVNLDNPPAPPTPKPRTPRKPKPPAATAPAIAPEKDQRSFPADPMALQPVRRLGGSTGAELVLDPATGELFVRKMGASPEHIRSENHADELYRSFGVLVPDSKLYERSGATPVKLSRYLDDAVPIATLKATNPKLYAKAIERMKKDYAVDAVLGNWDVMGMDGDNVLVTPDGTPYRVDNGGSLEYRAMGTRKADKLWTDYPLDIWSITDPKVNVTTAPKMLKGVDWATSAINMKAIKESDLPDSIPASLKARVIARAENARVAAKEFKTLSDDIFVEDYANSFAKASMVIKERNILEHVAKTKMSAVYDPNDNDASGGLSDEQYRNIWGFYGKGDSSVTPDSPFARFLDLINDTTPTERKSGPNKIGNWDVMSTYLHKQSLSSDKRYAMAGKVLFQTNFLKTTDRQADYYWHNRDDSELDNNLKNKMSGREQSDFINLAPYQHAYTYNLLRTLPLEYKSPDNERIALVRTVGLQRELEPQGVNMNDKNVKTKRGLLESFGMNTVFRQNNATTIQSVPIHRGFVSYIQGRDANNTRALLGDGESELVTIAGGDVRYDVVEKDFSRQELPALLTAKAKSMTGSVPDPSSIKAKKAKS